MNRSAFAAFLILLGGGLLLAYSQQRAEAQSQGAPAPVPEYRVMHLSDLFEADEEAKEKIAQLSVQVTGGTGQVRVNRTDMDSKDYERALNRWAKEGWRLVTVNKSNYWVFEKQRPEIPIK